MTNPRKSVFYYIASSNAYPKDDRTYENIILRIAGSKRQSSLFIEKSWEHALAL